MVSQTTHQEDACPTVVVGSRVETAVATTGSRRCVRSLTRHSAVLAFDLAADKQVCALTDQDSRVLARRTVVAKAWQLREAVEWGLAQAAAAGFSSVVVACEPTGHRWRVLDQIAAEAGARLVSVSRCWCTGLGRARTSPATRAMRPTR